MLGEAQAGAAEEGVEVGEGSLAAAGDDAEVEVAEAAAGVFGVEEELDDHELATGVQRLAGVVQEGERLIVVPVVEHAGEQDDVGGDGPGGEEVGADGRKAALGGELLDNLGALEEDDGGLRALRCD